MKADDTSQLDYLPITCRFPQWAILHGVPIKRLEPTPAQIKAIASPLRIRIVRLCNDREWTNQELAERLERDPATILHHLRLLVDAGFVEATEVRQGSSGAYEKPYRSTGLSWQISFGDAAYSVVDEGEVTMLRAFRDELAEAGNDSIADLSRFHLHLDENDLPAFLARVQLLLDEYSDSDDDRRDSGAPSFGGLFAMHRLAEAKPDTARPRYEVGVSM
jgi:DNA-binding transcriptional ArsR family regulator